MNFDISDLLGSWEYQAGQIVVRKFQGKDGQEKLQLRVDLGLLQMNLIGRPDGKKPFGAETLLDHYLARLRKHKQENDGSDTGFKLTAEECSELQQEAIQFHHRYICLYQLKDFAAVIRDAERNLRVFEFVEKYAEVPELAVALNQFKPQLFMVLIRARASMALGLGEHDKAIALVEEGIDQVREFFTKIDRPPEVVEQTGEVLSLQAYLEEIRSTRPLSKRERLQKALDEAIEREDFERAAKFRDLLRELNE